jgi:hypothetical protein
MVCPAASTFQPRRGKHWAMRFGSNPAGRLTSKGKDRWRRIFSIANRPAYTLSSFLLGNRRTRGDPDESCSDILDSKRRGAACFFVVSAEVRLWHRREDRLSWRIGQLAGVKLTLPKNYRISAVDPQETFRAAKTLHLVTIGRFSERGLIANLLARAATYRASASSPLSHSSVSLSGTRSIVGDAVVVRCCALSALARRPFAKSLWDDRGMPQPQLPGCAALDRAAGTGIRCRVRETNPRCIT